jgi:hypothetical protein
MVSGGILVFSPKAGNEFLHPLVNIETGRTLNFSASPNLYQHLHLRPRRRVKLPNAPFATASSLDCSAGTEMDHTIWFYYGSPQDGVAA